MDRSDGALLTEWKQDPESEWLNEVSSVPLQQSLRHLNSGFDRRLRPPPGGCQDDHDSHID